MIILNSLLIFFNLAFATSLPPEVKLRSRELAPRVEKCGFCHTSKTFVGRKENSRAKKPRHEHAHIEILHGNKQMECDTCHDPSRGYQLVSLKVAPADFMNTSYVCYRCHADILMKWKQGVHGKRIGYWNGPKTQFHCIDCHNQHNVRFATMKPEPPPPRPKFGIKKEEGHQ